MEIEEEAVNDGRSGAAAFTNKGHSFKKPLFTLWVTLKPS